MTNLAIKGHATRGEEVIEILEMLGGKNVYQYEGYNVCSCLFIDEVTNTIHSELLASIYYKRNVKHHILTLEEFLKKYPYKVGDKVRIPEYESEVRIDYMKWDGFEIQYSVFTDETEWYTAEELNEYNEPNNEEIMKETNKAIFEGNAQCCNIMNDIIKDNIEERKYAELRMPLDDDDKLSTEVTIDGNKIFPPNNYLIGKVTQVDNGMLVEFVKKSQYPDTYKECCSVLGMTYDYPDIQMVSIEECNLYSSFIQLIRCRDAYWKIAGKEIGLGKPWKPTTEIVYCISRNNNIIKCSYRGGKSNILEFPTEEMRNAFYENFKDLIEECKELL